MVQHSWKVGFMTMIRFLKVYFLVQLHRVCIPSSYPLFQVVSAIVSIIVIKASYSAVLNFPG